MKLFLSLFLALFLPIVALAGNGSGNVSSVITLGGLGSSLGNTTIPVPATSASASTFFTLSAGNNVATNLYVNAFFKPGTTTQYQVTAGKVAYCYQAEYVLSGAGSGLQLMYDTATYTANSAASGTAKFQGGATTIPLYLMTTAYVPIVSGFAWNFPASSYPGFQYIGGANQVVSVQLICQEL